MDNESDTDFAVCSWTRKLAGEESVGHSVQR